MTILHVISGLSSGGAEGVLYRLILADKHHRHIVVSLTDRGLYYKKMTSLGVEVFFLSMPRGKLTFAGLKRLYSIIRKTHVDVVQTWMYHSDLLAGILARIAGVKSVIWGIRGPYNRKRTSFSTKIVVYFCMILSRWIPKTIISNSYFAREAHVDIGYFYKKFKVIPNGYQLDPVRPSEQERVSFYKLHQVDSSALVLGMVSRFDPHKDHNNLFSALKVLQLRSLNFVCLLVGSGMDEGNADLISLLNQHNISDNCRLLGRSDNVPEIMSLLDVHILSSAAESFPNVLAEAMLMGTPCVTTDVGDAAIIVADTGWVVPAEKPELLANAIEDATIEMKDSTLWSKRQLMCRERIEENYGLDKMISAYHDIWEEAINEY